MNGIWAREDGGRRQGWRLKYFEEGVVGYLRDNSA